MANPLWALFYFSTFFALKHTHTINGLIQSKPRCYVSARIASLFRESKSFYVVVVVVAICVFVKTKIQILECNSRFRELTTPIRRVKKTNKSKIWLRNWIKEAFSLSLLMLTEDDKEETINILTFQVLFYCISYRQQKIKESTKIYLCC